VKILWLTWKDSKHPHAGGAEVVSSELAKRLVKAGHEVTFVTSGYKGASQTDSIDGYSIVRVGGRFTVYWQAYRYIKKNLADWPDFVVEEINTIPSVMFSSLSICDYLALSGLSRCLSVPKKI
jgi:glycogen synthase